MALLKPVVLQNSSLVSGLTLVLGMHAARQQDDSQSCCSSLCISSGHLDTVAIPCKQVTCLQGTQPAVEPLTCGPNQRTERPVSSLNDIKNTSNLLRDYACAERGTKGV